MTHTITFFSYYLSSTIWRLLARYIFLGVVKNVICRSGGRNRLVPMVSYFSWQF